MKLERSSVYVVGLIGSASLWAGCSKSTPGSSTTDNRSATGRDAHISAVAPSGLKTKAGPPIPSEPAVLQATLHFADGGSCNATMDDDCRECLIQQGGKELVDSCDSIEDNATEGTGAGTPRARLCREMLDCVRRTSCHANSLIDCYCGGGDITLGECQGSTNPKGVCRKEIDRALEIRPLSIGGAALDLITEPKLAGGVAGVIATAENTGCPRVCIPYKATSCP